MKPLVKIDIHNKAEAAQRLARLNEFYESQRLCFDSYGNPVYLPEKHHQMLLPGNDKARPQAAKN